MKLLISGSTGLVGSALMAYLASKGHHPVGLSRQTATRSPSLVHWNPPQSGPEVAALDGVEAVVHLAGENISSGRWTEARKVRIRDSRVAGTRLLVDSLVRMKTLPKTFISASAIGFYGDRGEDVMTEASLPGKGFLPDVCRAWEAAGAPLADKGVRVVHLRFGIILAPHGGALGKMLLPFKMGVGGQIGSGKQWMSWIALDDVLGGIAFALGTPGVRGAVNMVSPQAVTNLEFTKTLGKVLHRPTIFPMPATAARVVFGEMADALLLASTRVQPAALLQTGYHFQWASLETALYHLLKR